MDCACLARCPKYRYGACPTRSRGVPATSRSRSAGCESAFQGLWLFRCRAGARAYDIRATAHPSVVSRQTRATSLRFRGTLRPRHGTPLLPVVFVALVVMSWVVYSQTARPPRPLQTERVKDNLYMISGEGGNVAMRVTTEGVVLVDDMFYRNHDAILAQMKSITNQPLRYVINTHQHD